MSNMEQVGGRGRRELAWVQMDVFAEAAFEGNMLAVFPDATGLSDGQMQALARETNLSETTFVLPRDAATERERGVRVRIFTTQAELPFAGHPTLGTASWLWMQHPVWGGADEVRLDLNVGTVPVRFAPGQDEAKPHGEMTQRDPVFGAVLPRDRVAQALGLDAEDLDTALEPQVVSTGLPFLIVPLHDTMALQRVQTDVREMRPLLARCGATFAYCVAPAEQRSSWRARMQMDGVDDPATGSAAGCAISYLVWHGVVRSGEQIVIEQGIEVRRPSRIIVAARLEGDRVHEVTVAGSTIHVASGRFFLS